tara:strand:- start:94 stop:735 length:642 start_codon:yes stop_codon:yes gene_type:complete
MYSIYLLKNTITDLKYIGVCQDFSQRMRDHSKAKGDCRKLHFAIKKYGWENFTQEILFESWDKDYIWHEIEPFLIRNLKTKHPYGYNLTDGGEGVPGFKMSKESIERSRKAKLGKPSWNKGIPMSFTHKENIRNSRKGKGCVPCSADKKEKIRQSKLKYNWFIEDSKGLIEITKNLQEFCRKKKLHSGNLYGTFSGRRNHCKNYKIIDRKLII